MLFPSGLNSPRAVTYKFLADPNNFTHVGKKHKDPRGRHANEEVSQEEVSKFLGEANWPQQKVSKLTKIWRNLHPSIMPSLKNVHASGHPENEKQTTITLSSAEALATLPQETQKEIFREIRVTYAHTMHLVR
jgi:hypothetical protein